jgi:hypothetical protein
VISDVLYALVNPRIELRVPRLAAA